MSLEGVNHVILVLSGKGGVGKSSVTTQLALSLARRGHKVGVLDVDLTGPNIPLMFNVEDQKVTQGARGWIPVPVGTATENGGSICCMSLGFLLRDRGDSVVWRGPKKTAMVRQFMTDVVWGELDYLLIDTPPGILLLARKIETLDWAEGSIGTSDEHISLAEQMRNVNPDGAVIVTTPQAISTADVRKEINFCTKVGLGILGVVENMSGFVCPHCSECTNVFSSGGGKTMAEQFSVDFFGAVPIDPCFNLMIESQSSEEGMKAPLVEQYGNSKLEPIFKDITEKLVAKVNP
ncbi:P-loop containing nucleoside triphosphate hydrolase protein [Sphaerosporella brunnea]|uniref:P-loop containing nucleoside triphosphate hydrolase protein n=1 Tax=Sphaerosporella brunnea TaxID=1250544 RepID=A0A5J5EHT5_9PEZI|nr:P-loop containing nucleoside triphosphate hydrolase protein [Sphaerosporella brunnea]